MRLEREDDMSMRGRGYKKDLYIYKYIYKGTYILNDGSRDRPEDPSPW